MDPPQGLHAVHFGHADIHQDGIIGMGFDSCHSRCSVIGLLDSPAPFAKHGAQHKSM